MFTRDQIEEIKKKLIMLGTKDTQFPDAHKLNGEEIIAIVQDGENKKIPLSSIINDDFINVSKDTTEILTLSTAVSKIDINNRKLGQVITFKDSANSWAIRQFTGSSLDNWNDISLWKSISGIDELKSQVETNTEDISVLSDEIERHDASILNLNTDVSKLKDKDIETSSSLSELNTKVDTLKSQADTNTSNISSLNTEVSTLQSKVDENTTSISQINNNIADHEGSINQINAKLDEHTESINAKITTDRIEDGAVTTEKIATSAFDSTLSERGKIAPADAVGEKFYYLVGGKLKIEGEKKEGNLNTAGTISVSANHYYYEYNISELHGQTVKVSSTCNNKYVTLWSLSENMLVAGVQSAILGKGGVTSVIREDTIDLSQYPTAKYLYIGTYEPTEVAMAYTENSGEIPKIKQSLANVAETANNAKNSADNIADKLNPLTTLIPTKKVGNLNNVGNISAGGYRDSYNIEDFKDCVLEVSTTTKNQYVRLWALFSDEPTPGDSNPPRIAMGELTSVKQSDTIDLSQYPTAKVLVMGTYTESATSLVKTTRDIIANLITRVEVLEHNDTRGRIDIFKTDSEVAILTKMIQADTQGNTDVYWENGVYEFSSMYLYMRDTLGWTNTSDSKNKLGFPIGHNNRYYFNNATLIATQPSDLTNKVDVLATRNINGNFEIHDVTLVNNGGQYCIHDEAGSSEMAYDHKYVDVICKYNGTNKPFGCGTGFNATISLVRCMMFTNSADRIIAVHAPINNPTNKKVVVKFSMVNCYLEKSQIGFNASYFDGTRDDLLFFMCGCRAKEVFSDSNFTTIAYNNVVES